jgi:hypothetical protein
MNRCGKPSGGRCASPETFRRTDPNTWICSACRIRRAWWRARSAPPAPWGRRAEKFLEGGAHRGEQAVFCAFSSRKFVAIASTEPARVDTVVSRRTSASSTPREKFKGDSGPRSGRGDAEAIAKLVAALVQIHQAEHRFAQQLTGELQCRAARLGRDGLRGSMPAPRQKAAQASKSPATCGRPIALRLRRRRRQSPRRFQSLSPRP